MSFTLDKCGLSQSAWPCMPHQRGKTEYTGFNARLKALPWVCRSDVHYNTKASGKQPFSRVTRNDLSYDFHLNFAHTAPGCILQTA